MKKSNIIITSIVVGVVVIGILLNNRSKMATNSSGSIRGALPVSVANVTNTVLTQHRSFAGIVTANLDVAIVAEVDGRVKEVFARVGDVAHAGTVLIRIDDEVKKAVSIAAEANVEKAKKDFGRFESLHAQKAVTDQQFETAKISLKNAEAQYTTARRQYNDTRITTPITGIVTSRSVDIGTMVLNKMVVANVVDISTLKVKLNVAEIDVFHLVVGDTVAITTDIYPGTSFPGTIRSVSAKSDEAHTYPVEIIMSNDATHPLKAGMFARVATGKRSALEVVAIPRAALLGSVREPSVYVVENGIARLRSIRVTAEFGSNLQVLSGLRVGETVVVSGQNNLKDMSPVSIVK